MTFLPIVQCELRVAAPKRSTFGARIAAALVSPDHHRIGHSALSRERPCLYALAAQAFLR